MIRGTPSVSAHCLCSPLASDLLRKSLLAVLALAGTTEGLMQTTLLVGGIVGAFLVLLANLGARSWHFLRWKQLKYTGPGSFLIAYFMAIATGFLLPYVGHRSIMTGGKGAMEYVIMTALLVAAFFVVSDYNEIQTFLVVGSDVRLDVRPL